MQNFTPLFLISCAVLLFPSLNEESASEHVKKAKQALENNQFDEALVHVDSAIRLDPKNAEAYFVRASIRVLDRKYDEAISDLTQVITINPRFPKAYSERAFRYIMKEEWDKAERDYTEAIRVDPRDPEPLLARSMIYYDKEEYDKALADAMEAIRISKDKRGHRYVALYLAACPQAKYRDGRKALEHAKREVEVTGGKEGFEALAAAHAELGEFREAVKSQKKKIEALENEGGSFLRGIIKEQKDRLKLYEEKKPLRIRYMYERSEKQAK
jgi:tetratricopeptide (TPR) repeat protein